MMPRYLLLLWLSLAVLSCSGESPPEEEKARPSELIVSAEGAESAGLPLHISRQPVVLLLGSNLTVAKGLNPEEGFGALLKPRLAGEGLALPVLNAALAEETAEGALGRLRYLLEQPLACVVLEVGRADERKGTAPGTFSRNLLKLAQRIRQAHPQAPILVLPSSREGVFPKAFAAVEARVEGVAISPLLWQEGPDWQPGDRLLHGRLAESLSRIIARYVQ